MLFAADFALASQSKGNATHSKLGEVKAKLGSSAVWHLGLESAWPGLGAFHLTATEPLMATRLVQTGVKIKA